MFESISNKIVFDCCLSSAQNFGSFLARNKLVISSCEAYVVLSVGDRQYQSESVALDSTSMTATWVEPVTFVEDNFEHTALLTVYVKSKRQRRRTTHHFVGQIWVPFRVLMNEVPQQRWLTLQPRSLFETSVAATATAATAEPVRMTSADDGAVQINVIMHLTYSRTRRPLLSRYGYPIGVAPLRLRTGDIVLVSSRRAMTFATKVLTRSRWDHVAMVVQVDGMLLMLEALYPGGVQMNTLEARLGYELENGCTVGIRRLRYDSNEHERAIVASLRLFLADVLGRPYERNLFEMLRAAMPGQSNADDDLSSLFCSELIAAALQRMGFLTDEVSSNNYTPASFSHAKMDMLRGASLGPLHSFSKQSLQTTKQHLRDIARLGASAADAPAAFASSEALVYRVPAARTLSDAGADDAPLQRGNSLLAGRPLSKRKKKTKRQRSSSSAKRAAASSIASSPPPKKHVRSDGDASDDDNGNVPSGDDAALRSGIRSDGDDSYYDVDGDDDDGKRDGDEEDGDDEDDLFVSSLPKSKARGSRIRARSRGLTDSSGIDELEAAASSLATDITIAVKSKQRPVLTSRSPPSASSSSAAAAAAAAADEAKSPPKQSRRRSSSAGKRSALTAGGKAAAAMPIVKACAVDATRLDEHQVLVDFVEQRRDDLAKDAVRFGRRQSSISALGAQLATVSIRVASATDMSRWRVVSLPSSELSDADFEQVIFAMRQMSLVEAASRRRRNRRVRKSVQVGAGRVREESALARTDLLLGDDDNDDDDGGGGDGDDDGDDDDGDDDDDCGPRLDVQALARQAQAMRADLLREQLRAAGAVGFLNLPDDEEDVERLGRADDAMRSGSPAGKPIGFLAFAEPASAGADGGGDPAHASSSSPSVGMRRARGSPSASSLSSLDSAAHSVRGSPSASSLVGGSNAIEHRSEDARRMSVSLDSLLDDSALDLGAVKGVGDLVSPLMTAARDGSVDLTHVRPRTQLETDLMREKLRAAGAVGFLNLGDPHDSDEDDGDAGADGTYGNGDALSMRVARGKPTGFLMLSESLENLCAQRRASPRDAAGNTSPGVLRRSADVLSECRNHSEDELSMRVPRGQAVGLSVDPSAPSRAFRALRRQGSDAERLRERVRESGAVGFLGITKDQIGPAPQTVATLRDTGTTSTLHADMLREQLRESGAVGFLDGAGDSSAAAGSEASIVRNHTVSSSLLVAQLRESGARGFLDDANDPLFGPSAPSASSSAAAAAGVPVGFLNSTPMIDGFGAAFAAPITLTKISDTDGGGAHYVHGDCTVAAAAAAIAAERAPDKARAPSIAGSGSLRQQQQRIEPIAVYESSLGASETDSLGALRWVNGSKAIELLAATASGSRQPNGTEALFESTTLAFRELVFDGPATTMTLLERFANDLPLWQATLARWLDARWQWPSLIACKGALAFLQSLCEHDQASDELCVGIRALLRHAKLCSLTGGAGPAQRIVNLSRGHAKTMSLSSSSSPPPPPPSSSPPSSPPADLDAALDDNGDLSPSPLAANRYLAKCDVDTLALHLASLHYALLRSVKPKHWLRACVDRDESDNVGDAGDDESGDEDSLATVDDGAAEASSSSPSPSPSVLKRRKPRLPHRRRRSPSAAAATKLLADVKSRLLATMPIRASLRHVDALESWVLASVLQEEDIERRAHVLSTFIELASALWTARDVASSMAVARALSHSSVARLSETLAKLRETARTLWKRRLRVLTSHYRSHVAQLREVGVSHVPIVGELLDELRAADEAARAAASTPPIDNVGLVAFERLRALNALLASSVWPLWSDDAEVHFAPLDRLDPTLMAWLGAMLSQQPDPGSTKRTDAHYQRLSRARQRPRKDNDNAPQPTLRLVQMTGGGGTIAAAATPVQPTAAASPASSVASSSVTVCLHDAPDELRRIGAQLPKHVRLRLERGDKVRNIRERLLRRLQLQYMPPSSAASVAEPLSLIDLFERHRFHVFGARPTVPPKRIASSVDIVALRTQSFSPFVLHFVVFADRIDLPKPKKGGSASSADASSSSSSGGGGKRRFALSKSKRSKKSSSSSGTQARSRAVTTLEDAAK
jgi:RasGEF domain/C2 domain